MNSTAERPADATPEPPTPELPTPAAYPRRAPLGAERWILVVILTLAVTGVGLWAALVVPWPRGADEIDHFHYVHHIANQKALPDPNVDPVLEAHHPPLAHGLSAVWLKILVKIDEGLEDEDFEGRDWSRILGRKTTFSPGLTPEEHGQTVADMERTWDLASGKRTAVIDDMLHDSVTTRLWIFHAMRLPSVLLGLWTTLLLLGAIRYLVPNNPGIATALWAIIVLVPSYTLHFSTLSNDGTITWLSTLAGWALLRARHRGQLHSLKPLLFISVILGFAFLTKLNALGIAVFAFFTVLLSPGVNTESKARRSARGLPFAKRLGFASVLTIGPFLIASWWHFRQVALQGSPISSANHANFRPDLLRLEAYHPLMTLDWLSGMLRTVLGRFGNDGLESHSIYYESMSAIFVLALFGIVFLRRKHETAPLGSSCPVRPPLLAAGLGVGLLALNLGLLDLSYYARSGRYLLPAIVPIAVLGLVGLNRVFGSRMKVMLIAGAAWNALGLAFLVGVLMTTYTISASKYERGHVIEYIDSGHPHFDQATANGLPSPKIQRHAQLTPPRHSVLFGINAPQGNMAYKVKLPDPKTPVQIRVRYPSIKALARHDVPDPYLIYLVVNGVPVQGPISPWGEIGDRRIVVPQELCAEGTLSITWVNRAVGNPVFAVAEVWVEEAWVRLNDDITRDAKRVIGALENIDDEAHEVSIFALVGKELVGEARDLKVAADSGEPFNLTLTKTLSKAEQAELEIRIVDHDATLLSDTKVLHWVPDTFPQAGRLEVPDVAVLRVGKVEAERTLLTPKYEGLPAGRFEFEIRHIAGQAPFSSGGLRLQVSGGRLTGEGEVIAEPDHAKLEVTRFVIERSAEDVASPLAVDIITGPRSDAEDVVELDRFRLRQTPGPTAPGSIHKLP